MPSQLYWLVRYIILKMSGQQATQLYSGFFPANEIGACDVPDMILSHVQLVDIRARLRTAGLR